mmetsp:Transcript_26122/g.74897  ORF Transcript_26122/g.74897 Transcript_26122/m.74897 type:complete len:252 (+) Transcript_26122:814-1569(+)
MYLLKSRATVVLISMGLQSQNVMYSSIMITSTSMLVRCSNTGFMSALTAFSNASRAFPVTLSTSAGGTSLESRTSALLTSSAILLAPCLYQAQLLFICSTLCITSMKKRTIRPTKQATTKITARMRASCLRHRPTLRCSASELSSSSGWSSGCWAPASAASSEGRRGKRLLQHRNTCCEHGATVRQQAARTLAVPAQEYSSSDSTASVAGTRPIIRKKAQSNGISTLCIADIAWTPTKMTRIQMPQMPAVW